MTDRERLAVDVGVIRLVMQRAGDARDFSIPEVRQLLGAKDTRSAVVAFDRLVREADGLRRRIGIAAGVIEREATHGGWG